MNNIEVARALLKVAKKLEAQSSRIAERNYKTTGETKRVNGHLLYRVTFGNKLGGWLESPNNCYGNAKVLDEAMVYGNSVVKDHAVVSGKAVICDSQITAFATVTDNAEVTNSIINDKAEVSGNAKITDSHILSESKISGTVKNSTTDGKIVVKGTLIDSQVCEFPGLHSQIENGIVKPGQTIKNVADFPALP